MAAIRFVRIRHFRGIAEMDWAPRGGFNAIIGPGDSGKSTVLEAIDLVLGARRTALTDADFHNLDTNRPIVIEVTVGDLPRELLDLEAYIRALRGWCSWLGDLQDEPRDEYEPVLTLQLCVTEDCEPAWCLYSERLAESELPRDMRSDHRALISAQRLGISVSQHLAWGPRSVLARLSGKTAGTAAVLARANRAARKEFDIEEAADLKQAVSAARIVAREMAVTAALEADAELDARAVNVSNGAVALHGTNHVPLRALGIGSSRLMAAGLQVKAAEKVPVLLLDEAEHGLEPHRIVRLLHKLGSKSETSLQQIFLTTHSPVVLRELSVRQLWIARMEAGKLEMKAAVPFSETQGLLRSHPEAFLAPAVLVCEGLTEQGLVRGLDLFEADHGRHSLALLGVSLVNGGGIPKAAQAALGLAGLGFRVALLRDSDKTAPEEVAFAKAGGAVFCWKDGFATENQLFDSVPTYLLSKLLEIADAHHTADKVNAAFGSHSLKLDDIKTLRTCPGDEHRSVLAKAARSGEWFKRIDLGEDVGRIVVAPHLEACTGELKSTLKALMKWFAAKANDDP